MKRVNTLVSALRSLALVAFFIIGLVSASGEAKAGLGFPTVRLIPAPGPCCFYVQYSMVGGANTWTSIGCVPTPPAVINVATSVAGYANTPPPAPVWTPMPGPYFAPTGGAWVTIGTICVNPNGVNPFCVTFHIQGVNGQLILQQVCRQCGGVANPGGIMQKDESVEVSGASDNVQTEEMTGSEAIVSTSVFPNPVSDEATVTLSLNGNTPVTITLNDVTGNIVSTIENGKTFGMGTHSFNINASELVSGVYYVTVRSGDYTNTIQLNVVK